MNTEILERSFATARSHGLTLETVRLSGPEDGADVELEIHAGRRGSTRYSAVLRQELTDAVAAILPLPPRNPLVLAGYVSDAQGEVLRARGADYIDGVGNMHLDWDRLLIHVEGRKRGARSPRTPGSSFSAGQARIFSRSGIQVVFALLAWPALASAPLRDIAEVSATSLGTVHKVVDEMVRSGYLHGHGDARRLSRGSELVSRWVEGYVTRLAPKLENGRFVAEEREWWRSVTDFGEYGVVVGGELAASIVDPFLKPATVTLYTEGVPVQLLLENRLRRDDIGGDVFLRRKFWREPRFSAAGSLVPEVLMYADLIASGEPRQVEHAERMRGRSDRLVELDRS